MAFSYVLNNSKPPFARSTITFNLKPLLPHTLHQIALLNTWYQYIPIEPSRRQTKSDACDQSNSNPVSVTLGFNLDLSLVPHI